MTTRTKAFTSTKSNTATIMGGQEKVNLTINAQSVGKMLSALVKLYDQPEASMVRELISNALDATTKAKTTRKPVVTWDNNVLTVQDYGVGMSYEELKEVYCSVGVSTKETDFDAIGSYGIGSKSPLSLVDSFIVETVKDGELISAIVSQMNGEYNLTIIEKESTTRGSGTTISVDFRQCSCYIYYKVKGIIELYSHVCPDVEVEGIDIEKPMSFIPVCDKGEYRVDVAQNAYNPLMTNPSVVDARNLLFRIGGALYNLNGEFFTEYNFPTAFMCTLEPGLVDFSSSREQIIDNDRFRQIKDSVVEDINRFVSSNKEVNLFYPRTNLSGSYVMNEDGKGALTCAVSGYHYTKEFLEENAYKYVNYNNFALSLPGCRITSLRTIKGTREEIGNWKKYIHGLYGIEQADYSNLIILVDACSDIKKLYQMVLKYRQAQPQEQRENLAVHLISRSMYKACKTYLDSFKKCVVVDEDKIFDEENAHLFKPYRIGGIDFAQYIRKVVCDPQKATKEDKVKETLGKQCYTIGDVDSIPAGSELIIALNLNFVGRFFDKPIFVLPLSSLSAQDIKLTKASYRNKLKKWAEENNITLTRDSFAYNVCRFFPETTLIESKVPSHVFGAEHVELKKTLADLMAVVYTLGNDTMYSDKAITLEARECLDKVADKVGLDKMEVRYGYYRNLMSLSIARGLNILIGVSYYNKVFDEAIGDNQVNIQDTVETIVQGVMNKAKKLVG